MEEMGTGKSVGRRKKVGGLFKKRIEEVGYPLDMHKQETEEAGGRTQQVKLYRLVRIQQRGQ